MRLFVTRNSFKESESESDNVDIYQSAMGRTSSKINHDGAVPKLAVPPFLCFIKNKNDQRASPAARSRTPKFGRAGGTQYPPPILERVELMNDRSGNNIDFSSSGSNSCHDGMCKSDTKETNKYYRTQGTNDKEHRRRRRKELVTKEMLFLDAHHELL